eukprot:CAMPEP_0119425634 /NCGR_PEP_ID=MMETSP1335-20130426/34830_1 /TAXON_ID=259385 /ORGANISM="Chrysoculter rhomboideus, Strain RCC1486" /LENGTH=235 /DNA_ID=CAMNT_0007451207 /DNA_START=1 /DNA_END=708 /DNA_ORIENTATION=+
MASRHAVSHPQLPIGSRVRIQSRPSNRLRLCDQQLRDPTPELPPLSSAAQQIPNALSLSRVAVIPVICALWLSPHPWRSPWCAGLFGLATLTDGLDGYLARKLNAVSRFGAFLDPVTDKLLVCTCLVLLVSTSASGLITTCGLVAIAREIAVSALREWMAQSGKRDEVRVGMLGKCKTASQLVSIWLFFATPACTSRPMLHAIAMHAAPPLLVLSTVLSVLSMVQYFLAARTALF